MHTRLAKQANRAAIVGQEVALLPASQVRTASVHITASPDSLARRSFLDNPAIHTAVCQARPVTRPTCPATVSQASHVMRPNIRVDVYQGNRATPHTFPTAAPNHFPSNQQHPPTVASTVAARVSTMVQIQHTPSLTEGHTQHLTRVVTVLTTKAATTLIPTTASAPPSTTTVSPPSPANQIKPTAKATAIPFKVAMVLPRQTATVFTVTLATRSITPDSNLLHVHQLRRHRSCTQPARRASVTLLLTEVRQRRAARLTSIPRRRGRVTQLSMQRRRRVCREQFWDKPLLV